MQVTQVDSRSYLVDWKYKDLLRVGHEFKGFTICKLERYEHHGAICIRVTVESTNYKI